jgi:molecular chaperone DnaK
MPTLGIDLGTTNSAVAACDAGGKPEVLRNRDGERLTPSIVYFDAGEPVVGTVAKRSAVMAPENSVQFVKRHIGDRSWRFSTEEGVEYSAEDLSAMILRRLREDAEQVLNQPCPRAVVTVPAYFQDAQRQATRDAGSIAGIDVIRMINEPTAAALAYGLNRSIAEPEYVAVFDLGGGTFDVTAMRIAVNELTVLATGGDRNLGGMDWDNKIMLWVEDQIEAQGGPSFLDLPDLEQDLREKSELAKITLSQSAQARIIVSAEGWHGSISITREVLADITSALLQRLEVIFESTLEDAGLHVSDLTKVLMVGGSTRMPSVEDTVESYTGLKPSHELHPDEVVAIGAALQAGELDGIQHGPVSPHSRALVPMPAGRPVGVIDRKVTDVTAHSLGVIVVDGYDRAFNDIVLERGSQLPALVEKDDYATQSDYQQGWFAQVTQGEERNPQYVTIIGEAEVNWGVPLMSNHPLRCQFNYDIDGLIHARVFDGRSGHLLGELNIRRDQNLSAPELESKRKRLSGLSIQ